MDNITDEMKEELKKELIEMHKIEKIIDSYIMMQALTWPKLRIRHELVIGILIIYINDNVCFAISCYPDIHNKYRFRKHNVVLYANTVEKLIEYIMEV